MTQDGVDFGNIDTIPVVAPAGGTQVKVTVSVAELTGKQIQIQLIDEAGAEWKADTINISTYGHASAQHPYFGEGLLDRVVTSSTHNVAKSLGKRVRGIEEYQGYVGGFIYINTTGGGFAGSESYVNGTLDRPVNNLSDANILGAALSITQYKVSTGSSLTFVSAQEYKDYFGLNWTLALGGQNINGLYVHGACISGISAALSVKPRFEHCEMNGATLPPCHMVWTALTGNMIAASP